VELPIMAKKKKDDDEKQEESSGGSIAVNDAWTGMLVISLLALMVGTGFLAYDLFVRYDRYNVDPTKVPVPKFTGKPPEKPLEKKDEKEKDGDKKKDEKKDDKKEEKKDGARLRTGEHYGTSQCSASKSVLQRLIHFSPAPLPRRLEADIG
jgi:hypothetical protein